MLNKLFDLTGRVALVTGGNKGLGNAMARGLAEAAQIVIASQHRDELQAAAAEIQKATGVQVAYFQTDLTDRDQVNRLAEER